MHTHAHKLTLTTLENRHLLSTAQENTAESNHSSASSEIDDTHFYFFVGIISLSFTLAYFMNPEMLPNPADGLLNHFD
jgi:hypothetical protein